MSKFYDKEYYPSNYLTANDINELKDKINELTYTMTGNRPNLFDKNEYVDLMINYEYIEQSYRCRAIKLKPNTTYTGTVTGTAKTSPVILISTRRQVNGGDWLDLRKTSDTHTWTTDATGNLYIGTVGGTNVDYNNRILELDIKIVENNYPYQNTNIPITEGEIEILPTFLENNFLYIEDFRKLENNVYVIALNFISPERFITPKLWDEETYYNLSYTDLNRIINNMNVLYEHRAERPSIWNFQYNDNWEQPSTIDWEGEI